jgi:phosphate transport system permease protein
MHAPAATDRETRMSPPGEPLVWLCSAGLSLGLLMVFGLLLVIGVHGVEVFWPKPVVQIEIKPDSAFKFMGSKTLAGEIVKRQAKILTDVKEREAASAAGKAPTELQLYVGNKDVYGGSFVYLDQDWVARTSSPPDILRMERIEYGNAIGYPVAITSKAGERIEAGKPGFNARLMALVREVNARRDEINRIERKEIGQINQQMQQMQLKKKALDQDAERNKPALSDIDERLKKLQADYELLAKRAGVLREKQADYSLDYRLADGSEKSIPMGELISFYYPNQLTFATRAEWFLRNVWVFLSSEPREANTEGGVFPAIFGTFVMTLLMSILVTPFGVLAAMYLREYATQGPFVRSVRVAVNNLAGVPSIVFGVFGLGFFVYFVGGTIDSLFFRNALPTPTFGTGGILWAALTLALMTVPVVIVATEEALVAVPRGMREGSLACGASKWQTIQRIVLPSAVPGILTGLILAMARGAGEVAPLMLVGVVKLAPTLPLDTNWPFIHLERKFMHLGFHIYDLGFQSPDSEAAKPMVFATTFLLIGLVVILNLGAIIIRERIRRKYRLAAF